MKRVVSALVLCAAALLACKDTNLLSLADPSSLVGFYKLLSFTDHTGEHFGKADSTVTAGRPITVTTDSTSATVTITGLLELDGSRYRFTITFKTVVGDSTSTEETTDTGSYTISDSTMTTVSDDPEEGTLVAKLQIDGRKLTLEADEVTMVFEKQ